MSEHINEKGYSKKASDSLVEGKDYRGYEQIHKGSGMTGKDAPAEGEREPSKSHAGRDIKK